MKINLINKFILKIINILNDLIFIYNLKNLITKLIILFILISLKMNSIINLQ